MLSDQTMQLLSVLGPWFGAGGTILATIVALWLARRVERVRLKAFCKFCVAAADPPSADGRDVPPERFLLISVTNLGERAVTIDTLSWCIGNRKNKRFAIMIPSPKSPKCPKTIEHGRKAQFFLSFKESPDWMNQLLEWVRQEISEVSDKSIKTLRVHVDTSVGHTEEVVPDVVIEDLKTLATTK